MLSFTENETNGVVFMTSPNIKTRHAFTTRFGGVSSGIYESLNLAHRAGDDPDNVKDNHALLCRALGISADNIVCSNQIHGTYIRVATRDDCVGLFTPEQRALAASHQADGIITQTPDVVLMVFTADCVPVLLYDPVRYIAGAVHAGWRSTVSNITGIAVQKMEKEFGCSPGDIKAAIGPCISKCCYETDADVAEAVYRVLPGAADDCLQQHGDKYMVDLKQANYFLLKNAGLNDILVSDECTSCRNDKYWSHRRTNGQRGSQAALITIDHPHSQSAKGTKS